MGRACLGDGSGVRKGRGGELGAWDPSTHAGSAGLRLYSLVGCLFRRWRASRVLASFPWVQGGGRARPKAAGVSPEERQHLPSPTSF